jgi:hypothetical protein
MTMNMAQEKPMKHYRWLTVYTDPGHAALYDVWIEPDGSLHNPRGYPEETARAAALKADVRKAERLAEARKRGVKKRQERQKARIYEAARRIVDEEGIGQRTHCYCCRKYLTDPESIERGIGPECWQRVLEAMATWRRERAEATQAQRS